MESLTMNNTFYNEKHNYYENIDFDIIENTYTLKNFTSVNIKNPIHCNITIVKTDYPQSRIYIKGTQYFNDKVKFEIKDDTCCIYFDNFDHIPKVTKKLNKCLIVLYVNFNLGENLHIEVSNSGKVSTLISFNKGNLNVDGRGSIKASDFFDLQACVNGSGSIFAKNIKYKTDIKINGSGKINTGIVGAKLDIAISGSGKADIKEVFGNISATVAGNGNIITHSGKADNLNVTIAGSGAFDSNNLDVCNAKINTSDSADVILN